MNFPELVRWQWKGCEIVGRIGAGGMGEMWKARDPKLDRLMAIQVQPSKLGVFNYCSFQTGFRLARKAVTPSTASSVEARVAKRSSMASTAWS